MCWFRSNIAIDFIVILLETIKLALQNKQPLRFSSEDIYFKGNENVVYVIQNVKWWRREKQFSRHKTFVIWRSKDSLSLSDGKYQIALDFWCLKYPQIYFSVLLYFSDISNKSHPSMAYVLKRQSFTYQYHYLVNKIDQHHT